MIFDEDYDRSLWYIVKADKKNGKELVKFLRELPEEFITNVRGALKKAKNDEINEDITFCCHNKTFTDIFYRFDFDPCDTCITLTKCIDDGKMGEDLFELMLCPINKDMLEELEYDDEEWLGTVTNIVDTKYVGDHMQVTTEKEKEYNIHHFPIGYFVSHAKEILNGKRELVLFKPVSIKRVPKDITRLNLMRRRIR